MSEVDEIVFYNREVAKTRQAGRFGDVCFPLATVGGVLGSRARAAR
jgi:hypothetical protein